MHISLNYCKNKNFTSRFGSSTDYMTDMNFSLYDKVYDIFFKTFKT